MPRTPTTDTGASSDDERFEDSPDDRAGRLTDSRTQQQGGRAQQHGTQERDFAPGEDGECH